MWGLLQHHVKNFAYALHGAQTVGAQTVYVDRNQAQVVQWACRGCALNGICRIAVGRLWETSPEGSLLAFLGHRRGGPLKLPRLPRHEKAS